MYWIGRICSERMAISLTENIPGFATGGGFHAVATGPGVLFGLAMALAVDCSGWS